MNTRFKNYSKNKEKSSKRLFLELDAKFYNEKQPSKTKLKKEKKKKIKIRTESANLSKYAKLLKC